MDYPLYLCGIFTKVFLPSVIIPIFDCGQFTLLRQHLYNIHIRYCSQTLIGIGYCIGYGATWKDVSLVGGLPEGNQPGVVIEAILEMADRFPTSSAVFMANQ
ncbi:MAG: hypothetical protein V2A53_01605 [bacterium]